MMNNSQLGASNPAAHRARARTLCHDQEAKAQDCCHPRAAWLPVADRRPQERGFPFLRWAEPCRTTLLRASLADGLPASKIPWSAVAHGANPSRRL